ncbi:MAG: MipA/OmpV family protein [Oceanococcus sp.]
MRRIRLLPAAVFVIAGLITAPTLAQTTDSAWSWNLGLGLASINFPAYRGSAVRQTLALPVPSMSFTSPRFQLNRQGARLSLLDFSGIRFRISASGSLPVNSDDVPLREGMPDLDPSFELGPAAIIDLPCPAPWVCVQETLLRGVIASDFKSLSGIGWTLQPRLKILHSHGNNGLGQHDWRFTVGPMLASRRYHDYFYSVDTKFVTSTRPEYKANGGFSGWRSSLSYSYQRGRFGASLYAAFDQLSDSRFIDSPLVDSQSYVMAGVYLRWYFLGSNLP